MPSISKRFDFSLNGKGYMLARDPTNKGRAWIRSGILDAAQKWPYANTADKEAKYSNLPDEIDFAEVWDDWSGGFGHPYRTPDEPNTYSYSDNVDARFPNQLTLAQYPKMMPAAYGSTAINAERFIEIPLSGLLPAGAGAIGVMGKGYLAAYIPTGLTLSPFDRVAGFVSSMPTPTGRAALFGSFCFVPVSESSPFLQISYDGVTSTQGPFPARGFAIAGGRMWRAFGGHYLSSVAANADPLLTANWSATLSVGNGQMAINDMTQLADQLYIGMPDGIYAGDQSGSFFNVLPGPFSAVNIDNGRDIDVGNGLVVSTYADDIVYVRPNSLIADAGNMGPIGYNAHRDQIFGRMRCIKSYGAWYYVGAWLPNVASYILAGRQGPTHPIWHTVGRLKETARINRIHFDSITNTSGNTEVCPRMWIATDSSGFTGTSPLYYMNIPRLNGNPLTTDPTFSAVYFGNGFIDLGSVDRGMPGVQKIYKSVEVWADNLNPAVGGVWVGIYYDVDHSGTMQFLGWCKNSPKDVVYFASTVGSFTTGQSIALRIGMVSALVTATTTPVVRSIILRGVMKPRIINTVTAVVRIADGMRDRNGQPMRSAINMITDLRQLAGQDSTGTTRIEPVQLIDPTGGTSWVNIISPIEEREVYQQGSEYPELTAAIKMSVMEFTVNPWMDRGVGGMGGQIG